MGRVQQTLVGDGGDDGRSQGLSDELPRAGWGLKSLSCSLLRSVRGSPGPSMGLFCGYNQATAYSGVSGWTPTRSAEPDWPWARAGFGWRGETPSSANRCGLCSGKQSWQGAIGGAARGQRKSKRVCQRQNGPAAGINGVVAALATALRGTDPTSGCRRLWGAMGSCGSLCPHSSDLALLSPSWWISPSCHTWQISPEGREGAGTGTLPPWHHHLGTPTAALAPSSGHVPSIFTDSPKVPGGRHNFRASIGDTVRCPNCSNPSIDGI